jgi:hypothetical protein
LLRSAIGLTISQPFKSQSDEQQHRLGNEMVSRLPGTIQTLLATTLAVVQDATIIR